MARLSPAHMETEFFGLFLDRRAVAILGPLPSRWQPTLRQPAVGMATIIGWFVLGGVILLGVRSRRQGRRNKKENPSPGGEGGAPRRYRIRKSGRGFGSAPVTTPISSREG